MRVLGLFILFLLQLSCTGQANEKINGVSFVASREEVAQAHVDAVTKIHANNAAIMPFGFIRELNSPEIIFDTDRQWFGETRKGAKQYIDMLHKNKIKVMLKPQIWVWKGEFTGTLSMDTEEHWQVLEASYERFIMNYATLAQESNTEIFCIGTELEQFVKNRPDFWVGLIKKIRAVYKGKLTYAANWDEYPKTTFWDQLDFIGIDAYFPLCEDKSPSVEQLKTGWKKWKTAIAAISLENGKPILFTEYGYRSMDYTGKKPWLADRSDEGVNLEAQVNATQAIFEEFWAEEWFAGGYVWKWFIQHDKAGGVSDNQFTPQNKPAELVISNFYKQH